MSHRWEHEDEYLFIKSASRRALKEENIELYEQLRIRIEELDNIRWRLITEHCVELSPFRTFVEAVQQTALRLNIPFPDLSNPANHTDDGRFLFGISNGMRTVQIWPIESRSCYFIEIFDYMEDKIGHCYSGETISLIQAIIVLNRWFVEYCTIDELHAQCPWISREPFQLAGPRLTFEPEQ